jgi:hypothetical protein
VLSDTPVSSAISLFVFPSALRMAISFAALLNLVIGVVGVRPCWGAAGFLGVETFLLRVETFPPPFAFFTTAVMVLVVTPASAAISLCVFPSALRMAISFAALLNFVVGVVGVRLGRSAGLFGGGHLVRGGGHFVHPTIAPLKPLLVCESEIKRNPSSHQMLCGRRKCRNEFRNWPDIFAPPAVAELSGYLGAKRVSKGG